MGALEDLQSDLATARGLIRSGSYADALPYLYAAQAALVELPRESSQEDARIVRDGNTIASLIKMAEQKAGAASGVQQIKHTPIPVDYNET